MAIDFPLFLASAIPSVMIIAALVGEVFSVNPRCNMF
jgi:hypothetical protein